MRINVLAMLCLLASAHAPLHAGEERASASRIVRDALESIEACYHWAEEVGAEAAKNAPERAGTTSRALKTNRVYGLPAKSPVFAELAMHLLALAFAEAELGPTCLLSACLAINLHPGVHPMRLLEQFRVTCG
jgi:hypothetical protein